MNKNISELFGPIMEQEQAETHSIFLLSCASSADDFLSINDAI